MLTLHNIVREEEFWLHKEARSWKDTLTCARRFIFPSSTWSTCLGLLLESLLRRLPQLERYSQRRVCCRSLPYKTDNIGQCCYHVTLSGYCSLLLYNRQESFWCRRYCFRCIPTVLYILLPPIYWPITCVLFRSGDGRPRRSQRSSGVA